MGVDEIGVGPFEDVAKQFESIGRIIEKRKQYKNASIMIDLACEMVDIAFGGNKKSIKQQITKAEKQLDKRFSTKIVLLGECIINQKGNVPNVEEFKKFLGDEVAKLKQKKSDNPPT